MINKVRLENIAKYYKKFIDKFNINPLEFVKSCPDELMDIYKFVKYVNLCYKFFKSSESICVAESMICFGQKKEFVEKPKEYYVWLYLNQHSYPKTDIHQIEFLKQTDLENYNFENDEQISKIRDFLNENEWKDILVTKYCLMTIKQEKEQSDDIIDDDNLAEDLEEVAVENNPKKLKKSESEEDNTPKSLLGLSLNAAKWSEESLYFINRKKQFSISKLGRKIVSICNSNIDNPNSRRFYYRNEFDQYNWPDSVKTADVLAEFFKAIHKYKRDIIIEFNEEYVVMGKHTKVSNK